MRDVYITGVGMTPVAEHWDKSLRELAFEAVQAALDDAGNPKIDALYVANQASGALSNQEHIATLVADVTGMRGIEAMRIEAGEASGGATIRVGYLAVSSGLVDTVMVLGVEKMTDVVGSDRNSILATSLDADYEGAQGATTAAMAASRLR